MESHNKQHSIIMSFEKSTERTYNKQTVKPRNVPIADKASNIFVVRKYCCYEFQVTECGINEHADNPKCKHIISQ